MIVAAMLLCDRKRYGLDQSLQAFHAIQGIDRWYHNIQTTYPEWWFAHTDLYWKTGPNSRLQDHYEIDFWDLNSSWWHRPAYDQDQSRLIPIVIARNMALNYARSAGASHILFVDSDVVVPPESLEKLLKHDKPIVGGVVRGRGDHQNATYIFGHRVWERDIFRCAHGTLGFCLVRSDVFQFLSFRFGPHPDKHETSLSEDPAFAADAVKYGLADGWWIEPTLDAVHLDNPDHPLKHDSAVNDYEVIE